MLNFFSQRIHRNGKMYMKQTTTKKQKISKIMQCFSEHGVCQNELTLSFCQFISTRETNNRSAECVSEYRLLV